MEEHENEVELIDLLNIIWKRKWLIIISTFFLVIIVGVVSYLIPRVWEVDAIVMPSKILIQSADGKFEEYTFDDPIQITRQINEGSYKEFIANELNINLKSFPKLKAENFSDTKLIQIAIREKDVERAKLILYSLFTHLKRELDVKAEIEKATTEQGIAAFEKNINIIKQRIQQIEKEMSDIKKRTTSLEDEQRLILKKQNRSESESLGLLLYSNEIQESLRDYNELNELLSLKKVEEQRLMLEMEKSQEKIKRIIFAQFLKEPSSSLYPVFPPKKLLVLIAFIFGLMIFTLLAFFLEYLEKQKAEVKE